MRDSDVPCMVSRACQSNNSDRQVVEKASRADASTHSDYPTPFPSLQPSFVFPPSGLRDYRRERLMVVAFLLAHQGLAVVGVVNLAAASHRTTVQL